MKLLQKIIKVGKMRVCKPLTRGEAYMSEWLGRREDEIDDLDQRMVEQNSITNIWERRTDKNKVTGK